MTSFLIDTGVIGLFIFLLSMFQILVIVVTGKGIFSELALYLSLIHISEPRDRTRSRMPTTA
ncbi:hypothetical protein PVA38_12240 [Streptococcus pneumoniae D39]|nr:hypothetical protein PVA38_12240 [Streptococcus pneumoniae D39]